MLELEGELEPNENRYGSVRFDALIKCSLRVYSTVQRDDGNDDKQNQSSM